uniref:Toll-interacting protein n=1 Tax=Parastrongyloides trichosuri TaxID=131310 RepID=A0A0N4ZNT4_PARTI
MITSPDIPSSSTTPIQKCSVNIPELRKRVLLLKDMPDHFLRFTFQISQQSLTEENVIRNIDPEEAFYRFVPPNTRGRIMIRIIEAKLTKSYSIVRMDPYCRIRVGNTTFETPTHTSGGKNPKWDKTVNAYLPNGVDSFFLQVYDEKQFTKDECIAWAHIILKEGIFHNETLDDWYPLSGAQGDGREGMINLQISFIPIINAPRPVQLDEIQNIQEANMLFDENELNELVCMFPKIEKEVIRGVLEEKRGDKDATVTILLEINEN